MLRTIRERAGCDAHSEAYFHSIKETLYKSRRLVLAFVSLSALLVAVIWQQSRPAIQKQLIAEQKARSAVYRSNLYSSLRHQLQSDLRKFQNSRQPTAESEWVWGNELGSQKFWHWASQPGSRHYWNNGTDFGSQAYFKILEASVSDRPFELGVEDTAILQSICKGTGEDGGPQPLFCD